MNHPAIAIPDIFRIIDRNGSVYDVVLKYNYTVQSGSSRTFESCRGRYYCIYHIYGNAHSSTPCNSND